MPGINVNNTNGTHGSETDIYDVVIVGGGFGGCYCLWKFRKLGFRVHLIEAGSAYGGVWHWNSYPGARVDSETPYYQLTIPEVWKSWSWSERFPGHEELKRYFTHVDQVLGLSKDTSFNTIVEGADFDKSTCRWTLKTNTGRSVTSQFFIAATGSTFKAHKPHFDGIDSFQGQILHTAEWPKTGIEFQGKNVAVIGSGATAVQCVQEIAKTASHLTVYIRNPNLAIPMHQRDITPLEARSMKGYYQGLFRTARVGKVGGQGIDPAATAYTDHSEEERQAHFEDLWDRGGFSFISASFTDFITNPESNQAHYDFWLNKVRQRIRDPAKRDIVAPLEAPYPFATKRSSLEQDYYDCLDMDHVDIVNLKSTAIQCMNETGIVTAEDGRQHDHDAIILATGFDSMTGSLTSMGLRGNDGVDIKEKWKDGVRTQLGMTVRSCPNMFLIYGPQAPTAFTNGPIFIETQCDWVADMITKMRDEKVSSVEPSLEAVEQWRKVIQDLNDLTVFTQAESSWYLGTNIPGKKREQLNFVGTMEDYFKACHDTLVDWSCWDVVRQAE